jgi:hypothetical protein
MESETQPRKVNPAEVEILDSSGEVLKGRNHQAKDSRSGGFGGIRVIQGGPALLLLLPILIPILIFGFLIMAVMALFFGQRVMRVFSTGLRRR